MTKITLADAVSQIEVEVFGQEFICLPATRSVLRQVQPLEEKANDAATPDEAVEFIGQLLNVMLKSSNGSKKKPATVIKEKWEGDELTLSQIQTFVSDLTEAMFARPT